MKLEVGQKVFLKSVGNAARYGEKIREEVISKIGRKYFWVGKEGETNERFMTKFNVEDLRQVTDYSADWVVYFSKQEILDEKESNELTREIRSKFDTWGKIDLTTGSIKKDKRNHI